jgi:hypothetical protein
MNVRSNVLCIAIACVIGAVMAYADVPANLNTTQQCASECGIVPEAIVVAGVRDKMNEMLSALEQASGVRANYVSLCAQAASLRDESTALFEQLRLHPDDVQMQAQLDAVGNQIIQVKQQIDQSRANMFEIAASCLATSAKSRLGDYIDSIHIDVPPELRAKHREPAEWRKIAKALIQEKRCMNTGVEIDVDVSEYLEEIRTDACVVQAKENLDLYLVNTTQSFNQWPEQ